MGGQLRRYVRSFSGMGVQRYYEELPLGPKIMVSHPARVWCPPTDVFECDEAFVVKIALSGLRRGPNGELIDVEVVVEGDMVSIRGERTDQCADKRCRFFQMEIYYGPFDCRVRFGAPFDRDAIRAEYRDGFLEVIVPKAKQGPRESKRIEVRR
jgi:HSP20 family protein